jgi:hypothetical protein
MPFSLCSNFAGSSRLCAAPPDYAAPIAAINKPYLGGARMGLLKTGTRPDDYLTETSRLTPSLVLRA